MRLCYVTAFLDIRRDRWSHFQRTVDHYFQEFQPMLNMFLDHPDASNYDWVIFMDREHVRHLPRVLPPNIIVQEIDEAYLEEHSPLWQRLDREAAIMASEAYQAIVRHRLHHPEHTVPKYTIITHCKVDFVHLAAEIVPEATHFAWVDFGYSKDPGTVPRQFLDLGKMEADKVTFALVNPIDPMDQDVVYTLQHAPEKVTGSFFCGTKAALVAYRELYHRVHELFQHNNIADDDQHVELQCIFQRPDLFSLHHLGGFHKALTTFQKDS